VLLLDWSKSAALVFLAAILQVSVFSSVTILHGTPDLLLVTIICVALLRGPAVGAAAGFWGGLLIDTANLGTLGVTSLLLTIAGYWIGRYGETTGRDRTHAPFVSVAVITLLYAIGSLAFHYVIGDPAPARAVLWSTLFQGIALNLVLAWPMYALAKVVLAPLGRSDRVERIHAVG
jgi:rod shape-determining protein MreD